MTYILRNQRGNHKLIVPQYIQCVVVDPYRFVGVSLFKYCVCDCLLFAAFIFFFCLSSSPPYCLFFIPLILLILSHGHLVCMEIWYVSSQSVSISSFDRAKYCVIEYISRYGHYLDACRIGAKRIEGDQHLIYDRRFEKYNDTAVGA